MINYYFVNKYCCEDPRLIENYEAAKNDSEMWDCHHRLETDLGLSMNELKERNLYYDRPAVELIFLTKAKHVILHKTGEQQSEETRKKKSKALKGKNTGPKSEEHRRNISKAMTGNLCGEKNPAFGHCWMTNGINRIYPKKEDAYKYLELGYQFGKKLK